MRRLDNHKSPYRLVMAYKNTILTFCITLISVIHPTVSHMPGSTQNYAQCITFAENTLLSKQTPANITQSPCGGFLDLCKSVSFNVRSLVCSSRSPMGPSPVPISDFVISVCRKHEESYTATPTLNDCLTYVYEADLNKIAINETFLQCSSCKYVNMTTMKDLQYLRCVLHNQTLLKNNITATRSEVAMGPCYQFAQFTWLELIELCVTYVNETLTAGKEMTRERVDTSICAKSYFSRASLEVNIGYWKCKIHTRELRMNNITYTNIMLLDTICKPYISLTAQERNYINDICYDYVNSSRHGNLTFTEASFLNATEVQNSPCRHAGYSTWTLEKNNLFWQCMVADRTYRQNGVSVATIRILTRQTPCITFLTLTKDELDEECRDVVRAQLQVTTNITKEFIDSTICARAYYHNLTFQRNIEWWQCLMFVQDKEAAGINLTSDDYLNSICKPFYRLDPSTDNYPLPQWVRKLQYFIYVFVGVIGTTGNACVIFILLVKQKKLKPGDGFIVSLALTDLLSSIFTPVLLFKVLWDRYIWNWGHAACVSLHCFNRGFLQASACTLVAIAAERTRAIVSPFKPMLSGKNVILISVFIYIISFGMTAPRLYYQTVYWHPQGYWWCTDSYPNNDIYLVARLLNTALIIIVPFIIMLILYTTSMVTLVKQRRRHDTVRGRSHSTVNQESYALRVKQDMKVMKMFITVVTLFFVLVAPYWLHSSIGSLLYVYNRQYLFEHYTTIQIASEILPAVYSINSCINPFIYARMHTEIRGSVVFLLAKMSWVTIPLRKLSEVSTTLSLRKKSTASTRTDGDSNEMNTVSSKNRTTTMSTDETDLAASPRCLIRQGTKEQIKGAPRRKITFSDEQNLQPISQLDGFPPPPYQTLNQQSPALSHTDIVVEQTTINGIVNKGYGDT